MFAREREPLVQGLRGLAWLPEIVVGDTDVAQRARGPDIEPAPLEARERGELVVEGFPERDQPGDVESGEWCSPPQPRRLVEQGDRRLAPGPGGLGEQIRVPVDVHVGW